MIYITGDTHGDFTRFSAKRLRRTGMELTIEDYIIICGDFGLCWAKDKTTHCCGSSLQERLNAGTGRSGAPDLLTDYLETLE